jgi:medium-chain acyl-[acyl-carrier-protein] hydrolase
VGRQFRTAGVWTETVSIRSYEVDFRKQATPEGLCRYFLEAAWNHAEALGVGYSQLAKQNRVWVLARLLIKFNGPLLWGTSARLRTWPRQTKSALAMREFEIMDWAGNQIIGGSSAWLVLDANTRKPQRIDGLLAHISNFQKGMAIGQDPSKLTISSEAPTRLVVTANYSDIDVNGHVNSARYISWILDSFPVRYHQEHDLKLIALNYVSETKAGVTVSIHSQESAPDEWSHYLVNQDGAEVCRARTEWACRA